MSDPSLDFRNADWVALVKRTREKFGVSISEAHRIILVDEEVRRLVAIRVNRDPKCRAMAFRDMRENGDKALAYIEGDRIHVRKPVE